MQKIGLFSLCLAALAACSSKPGPVVTVYQRPACPPVPTCEYQRPMIKTNGDLLLGLMGAEAAIAQCQIANQTLNACLKD